MRNTPRTKEELVANFELSIERIPDSCWLWTGFRRKDGYGRTAGGVFQPRKKGTRNIPAHRLSWLLFKGPIGEGLKVCHKCDVPSCVNPDHLFLGTDRDNLIDCALKGRLRDRLSREKVREIFSCPGAYKEVAARFSVASWTVRNIKIRKTYRFFTFDLPINAAGTGSQIAEPSGLLPQVQVAPASAAPYMLYCECTPEGT